jgi:hypothetical protein
MTFRLTSNYAASLGISAAVPNLAVILSHADKSILGSICGNRR